MSDIRNVGSIEPRVETGPIQFGDDWPGTFIRGDNAAYYAMQLRYVLDLVSPVAEAVLAVAVLRGMLSDLDGSNLMKRATEVRGAGR